MAGRHRRPSAWRRLLTSLSLGRRRTVTAALQAEVVALRATVAALRSQLDQVRAAAATASAARRVTLDLPLVRLSFSDVAVDRGPDTVVTEIVLERAPARAGSATPAAPAAVATAGDRLAWSVLAGLPERTLLDPRTDRVSEPRDPAGSDAATAGTTSTPAGPDVPAGLPQRRTA